jgi:hypothetical protein
LSFATRLSLNARHPGAGAPKARRSFSAHARPRGPAPSSWQRAERSEPGDQSWRAPRAAHAVRAVRVLDPRGRIDFFSVLARFTDVRIPRESLLDRFGSVDRSGRYSSPLPSPTKRFAAHMVQIAEGALTNGFSLDSAFRACAHSWFSLVCAFRACSCRRSRWPPLPTLGAQAVAFQICAWCAPASC